jgi:putative exporter of polyketide antibiotics
MFEQDDAAGLPMAVAVGVAVIFAVIFVLAFLCGLFGLILNHLELIGFLGPRVIDIL